MNTGSTHRPSTGRAPALRLVGVVAVATGLVAACGGSDEAAGGLTIEGAWARQSPMMATAGAAYMDITAEETTSIVSASVSAEVAATVEIHETVPVDSAGEEDMDHSEMDMDSDEMDSEGMEMESGEMEDMAMTMRQVEALDLPAGETVSLSPGGLHVMLLDLPDALELGETFDLTLTTEDGTDVVVEVEVRDEAP